MKQNLFIIVTLWFLSLGCYRSCKAQACPVSLGSVVRAMNSIPQTERKVVVLETYKTFKYRGFKPADPISKVNTADDFYGVGFDNKHEIIEITYHSSNDSNQYKMLVYDFPSFKLMVVKLNEGPPEGFKYNFSVIIINKQPSRFFMYLVNLFPTDVGNFGLIGTPVFLKYGIDKISAIMGLTENLRPADLVRIYRTQILRTSEFLYKGANRIGHEKMLIHYNTASKPAPQIDLHSCLDEICNNALKQDGEIFFLNPIPDRADRLWHFSGMHNFRYENSRIISRPPE